MPLRARVMATEGPGRFHVMRADSQDLSPFGNGLPAQARHFELIFNSARDMMLLARVEPDELFRVVSVNRRYLETVRAAGFDLQASDLEGRTFAEVRARFGFDEATTAEMRARFEQVIRTGRAVEYDEITHTPSGVFHGRSTIAPITDDTGACAYLLYSSQDVTERVRAEQARRDSDDLFAAAFRLSPDAMSVVTMGEFRYLEINQAHERIFGYAPAELIGRTAVEVGLVPDGQATASGLAELQRTGRVRDYLFRARTRNGEERMILSSAERLRWATRDCALFTSRDVTAQLQAEQALRESEEKFIKAFMASPDAISVHELASGRYVEVNDGFLRLFGCAREEVVGRTPLELGIWAEPTEREGFVARLRREGAVRNHPVQVRNRRGQLRRCELSAETFEIGGRLHNVTVLRDVTERDTAEQALRESEEKFARAFRSSPQALIISALPSGRYLDVNLGFERITGYTRDEIVGRTSLEVGIWDDLADRDKLMDLMQRDGWARDLEFVFRGKHRRRIVARCSFELIEVAGSRCLLSVIEDITDQRRAEQEKAALEEQMKQAQRLEALGTLAGGIAHDFNNILTAIIVNQELALMDVTDPASLRVRLAEIGQASSRAKELVRQILTFSRQQKHERVRQQLLMIVREALGLLRASLPATIEIVQELSPEAPPVLADASQVHQIVMNLCMNAAHAMRDRPGRLTVRLARCALDEAGARALPGLHPGSYARLTVADTGHGMEAAVLARIFEPFFTTKGPGEGTGLGLAVVHGIMKEHAGGIFVQSLPGRGTTFDVYFPEAAGSVHAGAAVVAIQPGRGELIMVVDDEESVCHAVGTMLRRIGYRVQGFTDARLALERLRASPAEFSLLLTDRTMPHLTGPELIARARQGWPVLPALLMSGLDSGGPGDAPAPAEGYGRVAKPIEIAELARAVRLALDAPAAS